MIATTLPSPWCHTVRDQGLNARLTLHANRRRGVIAIAVWQLWHSHRGGVLDSPYGRRAKPTNPDWRCQVERFATISSSDPTLHRQAGVVPLGAGHTGDPGQRRPQSRPQPMREGALPSRRLARRRHRPFITAFDLLAREMRPGRTSRTRPQSRSEAAYATAPKAVNCVFASVVHKRIRMVVSSL
jgi:hypothetical protein